MKYFISVIMLLFLLSCASSGPTRQDIQANGNALLAGYKGASSADIIKELGPPHQTYPDGEAGKILTYRYFVKTKDQAGVMMPIAGMMVYQAPKVDGYYRTLMFFTDEKGVVYDTRWLEGR